MPHPDPVPEQRSPWPPPSHERTCASVLDSTPYAEIISAVSEAHGVDPMLVRALIQVESNYHPRARSSKGAMGLMQLMPSTAREYNVRNPYDPKANIEAGIKQLKIADRPVGASSSRWPPTTPAKGRSRSSTAFRPTAKPATTSPASSRSPDSSSAPPPTSVRNRPSVSQPAQPAWLSKLYGRSTCGTSAGAAIIQRSDLPIMPATDKIVAPKRRSARR